MTTLSYAQNIEDLITTKEVERIEKTLSSDEMEGRRTFTKGIDKAAAFIADEQGRLFTPSEYAARENAGSDETDQDVASDYLDAEFSEVGPNVNNYEQFGAAAGPVQTS